MRNSTQTAIDFKTIEAGRELDAIIAEKLMGWIIDLEASGPNCIIGYIPDVYPGKRMEFIPAYSTDITAAYQVEERIGQLNLHQPYLQALWDIVGKEANYDDVKGRFLYKHATPESICRAALVSLAK